LIFQKEKLGKKTLKLFLLGLVENALGLEVGSLNETELNFSNLGLSSVMVCCLLLF
jgi:hypothetical protein